MEARFCHLRIWPDFAGYGFNLHADRGSPGQYVGKVDEGSPAEAAGLLLNDRVVEVNGRSVDGKSHAEVVAEIKSAVGEVRLLVVDAATDEMCRRDGVKITASCLTNITNIACPDCNPASNTGLLPLSPCHKYLPGWRRGSVVRTSVFGWCTFPDLLLTCDHFKVSAMVLSTSPTQPSILSRSVNE